MRHFFVFLFTVLSILTSCTKAQNGVQKVKNNLNFRQGRLTTPIIRIDSIADIPRNTNERTASFIKKRLEALIGSSLRELTENKGITYPPAYILFRSFKKERELEIWAANKQNDSLHLIVTLPICAVDHDPSPKLQEGDGKTPEGYYKNNLLYGSSYYFMWIKLNSNEINKSGEVWHLAMLLSFSKSKVISG